MDRDRARRGQRGPELPSHERAGPFRDPTDPGRTTGPTTTGLSGHVLLRRSGYYDTSGANLSASTRRRPARSRSATYLHAIATQHSGAAFNVTVIARAQDGSALSSFNGTVTLRSRRGRSRRTSATMTNGSLTRASPSRALQTNETITAPAARPARAGASAAFTLNTSARRLSHSRNGGTTAGPPADGRHDQATSAKLRTRPRGTCGAGNSATTVASNDANPDTSPRTEPHSPLHDRSRHNGYTLTAPHREELDVRLDRREQRTNHHARRRWRRNRRPTVAGGSTATYLPNAAIPVLRARRSTMPKTPSVKEPLLSTLPGEAED